MSPIRGFAKGAVVAGLVSIGLAATPLMAVAQPQGQPNSQMEVPYSGSGGPVDQQNLPPAPPPPPNYAPQDDSRQNYAPPPPPPSPPPGAYERSEPDGYAARDSRDDRSDYAPPPASYGQANDDRAYGDRPYQDDRGGSDSPPPPRCQMVEQRTFFPDDTTQRTRVRACLSPRGHWRIEE
jgi:hypothetical protein